MNYTVYIGIAYLALMYLVMKVIGLEMDIYRLKKGFTNLWARIKKLEENSAE